MKVLALVMQSRFIRILSVYRCIGVGILGSLIVALALYFNQPTELVLIDSSVHNPQFFLSQLHPHQRGWVLSAKSNLASVTHQLQHYRNLQAVHVISHGAPGQFQLGQTVVNTDSVKDSNQRHLFTNWQHALAPGGDIFLYGCEVGATAQGQTLLAELHQLTQADLAASTTLSGDPLLHGDWQLESTVGTVATSLPLTGLYGAVLRQMTVTTHADDGTGSLRWAITEANRTPEDDLIELHQLDVPIVLQSPLPVVTSNLYLFGHGATLSGHEQFRVLHVKDSDVVVQDLTIADGLAQGADGKGTAGGDAGLGGGLLIENGSAILSQVQLINNRAAGGDGGLRLAPVPDAEASPVSGQIDVDGKVFKVNRGAIAGLNGISLPNPENLTLPERAMGQLSISGTTKKLRANRGAIAGVNGIGVGGIGSIAFGGGGGFGGFGNAGNGGNGGNGGAEGGSGGNGGDGGDGGVGIFGGFGLWEEEGSIGTVAFGGGGGFGGFGNAGNGGNGGNAVAPVANGGNGGNGGQGGFGGGGGGGGFGGQGGYAGKAGKSGIPGKGGFGGGNGEIGYGGGGVGFGGAIFLKSSRLILNHTVFDHNTAIAGQGAHPGASDGSSIFVWSGQEQKEDAMQDAAAVQVISLGGAPTFNRDPSQSANGATCDVFGSLVVFGGR
ncbi:MAG: DUF4347 domain-containing protein [Thainema sp.]